MVRFVMPVIFADVAWIVETPGEMPTARPVLSIVAEFVAEELQVTSLRGCVVPSVNVPVATNCSSLLIRRAGFVGETAMDTNCAAATVADVEPDMLLDFAETITEPCFIAVKRPLELIVAIVVSEVDQSRLDSDFVDPSE
jgi:hypothetical protein